MAAGLRQQPLHPVAVALADASGALDGWAGRVGFRTVALDTTADADGSPFPLVVNGMPSSPAALNWIPDDCFPFRVTPSATRERLDQARGRGGQPAAGLGRRALRARRLLRRVRRARHPRLAGLPLACAAYQGGAAALRGRGRGARGRTGSRRTRPGALERQQREHLGARGLGLEEPAAARAGAGLLRDLLPGIVAEVDATRPYWPGSPFAAPDVPPERPGARLHAHLGRVEPADYTHYRDSGRGSPRSSAGRRRRPRRR